MTQYKFRYDYSKTLWMKMFLAKPDFEKGVSEVLIDFDTALSVIKTVDRLTPGVLKIIYLVGWQGLGHDDCYPEMEVVNPFLKSPSDKTASDSLFRIFNEAKKYNTVVSFHGNLADEYAANASHEDIVRANAVVNGLDGKPAVIEVFNNRPAYKISYKQYYESGLFKKYWDRFCEATPVREAGTVHLDNFCVAESLNPRTAVEEQSEARNKMLDYINSLGIDVTTEYTYRELLLRADSPEHPIRKFYAQLGQDLPVGGRTEAPIRTLGRIPASWWTSNMTAEDCINIPASLYSGHLTDKALLDTFYGAMHGEDIWMEKGTVDKDWVPAFLRDLCTLQVPYFYLNRFDRLSAEKRDDGTYKAEFGGGVISDGGAKTIVRNGVTLKDGGDVCLPLTEDDRSYVIYSENGKSGVWQMPDARFEYAETYDLGVSENKPLGKVRFTDQSVRLDVKPGQAILLKAVSG